MTLSTRIAPHLPYLRRYSRALTGTQTSGDAYVAAVLEAIIADLSIFPDTANDRVALYKLFTQLFGSTAIQIPDPVSPYAWEQRASVNLSRVSPVARQAFLLASVENFRLGEIAQILDVEEPEVVRLLDKAEIPNAPVSRPADLFEDPHLVWRQLFKKYPHPSEGEVMMVEPPMRMSRTPPAIRRMAPLQGADSRAVLAEAGLDEAEIAALKTAGALIEP